MKYIAQAQPRYKHSREVKNENFQLAYLPFTRGAHQLAGLEH